MPRPRKVKEQPKAEQTTTQPDPTLIRKRTIDDIWKHKYSKYKTSDAKVYKDSLAKMNKIDLQRECLRVGLMPHDKRDIMGERLMKQFLTYQAGLKPVIRYKNGTGSTDGRAQDILSRIAPRLV